jgi:hypothetical protein
MSRKLVMGYTKHGDKCHLVDGDDLAVALCGARIAPNGLMRRIVHGGEDRGELILFSDHWRNGACGVSSDRNCTYCEKIAGVT